MKPRCPHDTVRDSKRHAPANDFGCSFFVPVVVLQGRFWRNLTELPGKDRDTQKKNSMSNAFLRSQLWGEKINVKSHPRWRHIQCISGKCNSRALPERNQEAFIDQWCHSGLKWNTGNFRMLFNSYHFLVFNYKIIKEEYSFVKYLKWIHIQVQHYPNIWGWEDFLNVLERWI